MKIWSDSSSYLNSVCGGYTSSVERILSGKYTNGSNSNSHNSNNSIPDKGFYYHTFSDCSEGTDETDLPDNDFRPRRVGPSYDIWTQFSQNQEHTSRLVLQLANTLHIQACDPSHWFICNPIEAGNIAVVDEESVHRNA